MTASPGVQHELLLPLPVAALVRYAGNAKSAKDRHDAAHRAWEASIQLAVAARPPADLAPLVRGALGHWCAALSFAAGAPESLDSPEILAAHALFAEIGAERKVSPSKIAPRTLFEHLPAYRNAVIGHAGVRPPEFYDRAAKVLVDGLLAAWEAGLFLPRDAHLVYAEEIVLDAAGGRRARLYDLAGHVSHVVDPTGTRGIPDDLLPRRVYVLESKRGRYRALHPLVLYHEQEQKERVLFFNGYGRRADYLDYAGGEKLKEIDRRESFPSLDEEVRAFFAGTRIAAADETPSEAPDQNRFGDYEILGKLGEGGMGVVYLARQVPLRRIVALKMLPAEMARDPVRVARFRREITALGKCDHPNVVKIFASGETNGTPYYAMEYVDGPDLKAVSTALSSSDDFHTAVSSASDAVKKEREALFASVPDLSRRTPSEPSLGHVKAKDRYRQLARAFRDAGRGVQELHDRGIIHRDLKPENLMVTAAEHRVVVMDLGLAKVADASRSLSGDKTAALGTLRYMPREQLLRSEYQVDHRADIYSLGATLYELIANRPIFDGDNEVRLRQQIIGERPEPMKKVAPDAPRDLATIVETAIEKDAAARYATAHALSDDLARFLEGRPIAAKEHGPFHQLYAWAKQNKGWAATIAAAFVALVASLFVINDARLQAEDARFRADESAKEAKRQEEIAKDSEARAKENEARAKENEARAKENELKAEAASAEAQREKDQVLRLSDVQRLKDLETDGERLWPAHPKNIAGIEDSIGRARELAGRLDAHRERLAALEGQALPYDDEQRRLDRETHPEAPRLADLRGRKKKAEEALAKLEAEGAEKDEDGTTPGEIREFLTKTGEEIASLETEVAKRRTWKFEDKETEWQHGVIAGLVAGIESLTRGDDGWPSLTIAALGRRLEFARTIRERSIDDEKAAWDAAITGMRESDKYGGLAIAPQLGLVPIGQDPESHLFEFWHVQSGERPVRGEDGKIAPHEGMGIVLVLIPGGTFSMGSPEDEKDRQTNEKQHDVKLDPYFISKYEMTQGQWERFAGRNPSGYKPPGKGGDHAMTLLNPVEQVGYDDCAELLGQLGLTLPTEAQWERAARGGRETAWWTGAERETLRGNVNIADQAAARAGAPWQAIKDWPDLDDGHVVHAPIGSFPANPFGLHEVAGNVWEWCRDWYGSYDLGVMPGDGERKVPASERGSRVPRGGSFAIAASLARSAARALVTPEHRGNPLGVRPAKGVTSE